MILTMKTGYNDKIILQSVKSDETTILDKEWKTIKWKTIEYGIFKTQKRIFEAEKEGNSNILSYKTMLEPNVVKATRSVPRRGR